MKLVKLDKHNASKIHNNYCLTVANCMCDELTKGPVYVTESVLNGEPVKKVNEDFNLFVSQKDNEKEIELAIASYVIKVISYLKNSHDG